MMLERARAALRLKTQAFDDELISHIEAAAEDLRLAGIAVPNDVIHTELKPLILEAIIVYCKANFGFNNDTERFAAAYENMKIKMRLAGDYREVDGRNNSAATRRKRTR